MTNESKGLLTEETASIALAAVIPILNVGEVSPTTSLFVSCTPNSQKPNRITVAWKDGKCPLSVDEEDFLLRTEIGLFSTRFPAYLNTVDGK